MALLESIREFALECLDEAGEGEALRRRHAEHFLAFAEASRQQLETGAEQATALARLALEHDNMRVALGSFASAGEAGDELRLAVALKNFWWVRGHLGEGRRAVEGALARAEGVAPSVRADALTTLAVLSYRQGAFDAAKAAWEQSLDLYREVGDTTGVARTIGELGSVAASEQDYERAASLYEESASLFRSIGDRMRLASVLGNLGAIANIQGDYERGRPLIEEVLALNRELGAKDDTALNLYNLGSVALREGRYADSAALLGESLELGCELGYRELIAYGLAGLAALGAAREEHELAARLLGAADALFEELGVALSADDAETYEQTVATLRDRLGEDSFEKTRDEGRVLEFDRAIGLAVELRTRASREQIRDELP